MTYREIAIVVLATIGVVFSFISAIGIVRLPDVYARMHAAGKASTLGVMCILLSAGIFFPDQTVIVVILIRSSSSPGRSPRRPWRAQRIGPTRIASSFSTTMIWPSMNRNGPCPRLTKPTIRRACLIV